MPASRRDRCAATVVSRSSDRRTGVGAMRWASWSASSIASLADEPERSARVRGNPTTTSTALNSSASCASLRKCLPVLLPRSRSTVSTGVARIPSGALAATPMRTVPTSTPSRLPRPGSSPPGRSGRRSSMSATGLAPAYFCAQRGQCRVYTRRPLTGTLFQIGLAAPTTIDRRTDLLDQLVGPKAEILRGRVDRHHERHAVVLALGDQRDDGRITAQFAPDVADERAQIRRRHPAGHPLGHDTNLTDLLRTRGGIRCGCSRVRQPHPVELLLGGPQPLDQIGDAGRNLLRRHL